MDRASTSINITKNGISVTGGMTWDMEREFWFLTETMDKGVVMVSTTMREGSNKIEDTAEVF